jgi:hypothetical protein
MTTKVEQFVTGNQSTDFESFHLHVPLILRSPRILMSGLLIFADFFGFLIAWLGATGLMLLMGRSPSLEKFLQIVPFILLSQIVFALRGLYPAIGVSPVALQRQFFYFWPRQRFGCATQRVIRE